VTIAPNPKIVVVPSIEPAFGKSGGGLDFTISVAGGVLEGVGVEAHTQFGDSTHVGVRQRLLEQTRPDAQSLLVTQPLLQPIGGVGVGVAQIQLDELVHTGLRHRLPLQVRPD